MNILSFVAVTCALWYTSAMSATYEVSASSAAVFADPLALYTEDDPANVVIVVRLARGVRFNGRPLWRAVPSRGMKIQWIARDEGGYVLPDCVQRVRV